jgi:hypothetical protein
LPFIGFPLSNHTSLNKGVNMASWLKKLFQTGSSVAAGDDKAAANIILDQKHSEDTLDVHAAIQAHMAWKQRLEDLLATDSRDGLDPLHVCRDDQCQLGKWIHSDTAAPYVTSESYKQLRSAHADFHQAAAKVIILAQVGDDIQASEELHTGEFVRASARVKQALARIGLNG